MSQVVAVFDDDAFRQSKTTWKIQPSHVFEEINGPNKFDHQEFVRFIRHTIAGVDFDPDDFVDSVLAVTFATGSETRSEITRGKNTLGKTVMREVTGFARIPEDVVLTFEPFPSSDIFTTKKKVSVNCSVFTDATDQTIELTPKPGQIDAAKAEALDALRLRVAEVTGLSLDRVLAGTP